MRCLERPLTSKFRVIAIWFNIASTPEIAILRKLPQYKHIFSSKQLVSKYECVNYLIHLESRKIFDAVLSSTYSFLHVCAITFHKMQCNPNPLQQIVCHIWLETRHNGLHFENDVFKWIVLCGKCRNLIPISLKLASNGPIENMNHTNLFGPNPVSEQRWYSSLWSFSGKQQRKFKIPCYWSFGNKIHYA